MRLLRWIATAAVVAFAACGACVAVASAMLDAGTRDQVMVALFGPYPDGRDPVWHTASGEELVRAQNDHFNIVSRISRCFPEVNLAWESAGPPANVAIAFWLNMQPNGEITWTATDPPQPTVQLTNMQSAILTLSRSTATARSELAGAAVQSRRSMLTYQWLAVLAGALTTIFVSIKSMSNNTSNARAYFVVGILAVIFSAVGTAVSGLNSFLSPSEGYVRSERALVQARQLHFDLAYQIAQENDLCHGFDASNPGDPQAKRYGDFAGRLKELVSAGIAHPGMAPSSIGAGSSSTPTTGGHP